MRQRILTLLLVTLAAQGVIAGESLGDAARREQERRKKNKEQGVQARVIGPDAVREARPRPTPTPRSGSHAGSVFDDDEGGSDGSSSRSYQDDSQSAQAQSWRYRANAARERVQKAREAYDDVIRRRNELVYRDYHERQAREGLERAEKELADVEEQARQQGVPPGWLR
jgi:hypothetical protein